jgi:hypothetical protein
MAWLNANMRRNIHLRLSTETLSEMAMREINRQREAERETPFCLVTIMLVGFPTVEVVLLTQKSRNPVHLSSTSQKDADSQPHATLRAATAEMRANKLSHVIHVRVMSTTDHTFLESEVYAANKDPKELRKSYTESDPKCVVRYSALASTTNSTSIKLGYLSVEKCWYICDEDGAIHTIDHPFYLQQQPEGEPHVMFLNPLTNVQARAEFPPGIPRPDATTPPVTEFNSQEVANAVIGSTVASVSNTAIVVYGT